MSAFAIWAVVRSARRRWRCTHRTNRATGAHPPCPRLPRLYLRTHTLLPTSGGGMRSNHPHSHRSALAAVKCARGNACCSTRQSVRGRRQGSSRRGNHHRVSEECRACLCCSARCGALGRGRGISRRVAEKCHALEILRKSAHC